jgi:hypothetical protein
LNIDGIGVQIQFILIIKPDGTGLYYDFKYAADGERIKAKDVYKCYKR